CYHAGRLVNSVGSRTPLYLGCLASCVAFVFLTSAHGRPWEFYVVSAILGVGIGLAFASLANLIVEAVRPDQTGVATGMNTVMRTVGGSVGSQIGATVLAGTVVGSALPTEHGYTLAFAFAAGACALAAPPSLAAPRPTTPATTHASDTSSRCCRRGFASRSSCATRAGSTSTSSRCWSTTVPRTAS